ncbi:MAG: NusG domain II-containing protein [Spirochaetaceae bacterium]|nr:MAG: NusG domain II-containing protein [Spirochaetaceae bacterium]
MIKSRVKIRTLDVLIFIAALLIIGLIALQTYVRGRGIPEITITAAEGMWIYPLDSEATLRVPGPLGDTVVTIREGSVQVLSSPCPEKICIKTGRISKPGQWIACLPNRVFIAVQGKRSEQPDAISQ